MKALDMFKRKKLYTEVFEGPSGEWVLKDLAEILGLGKVSVGATPELTYYQEGRRSAILAILKILGQDNKTLEIAQHQLNRQTNEDILND